MKQDRQTTPVSMCLAEARPSAPHAANTPAKPSPELCSGHRTVFRDRS